ncbi:acyltransferase [Flagellimonas sp. DF-77]|uniref:acyltransferase n=1 Tax=Flagellimonas algarum TaxID=3230298 RepID=UPI00339B7FBA
MDKQTLKKLLESHPELSKIAQRYRHGGLLKRAFTESISGRDNNISIAPSSLLIRCAFEIEGNNNTITIAEGCFLKKASFRIKGDYNTIHIGSDIKIKNGGLIYAENDGCQIKVGKATTFFKDIQIVAVENDATIEIGEDCMFGSDNEIRTSDHHAILDLESGERINPAKNVSIGNHVWVTNRVAILKGSTIGNHCILGAKTVTSGPYREDHVILAGNPARIVKRNITWDRSRIEAIDQATVTNFE